MIALSKVLEHIMDALDVETFLVCGNENEGRELIIKLLEDMGFKDVDIVFIQHEGPGARVRARGYVYRPGDKYQWLK